MQFVLLYILKMFKINLIIYNNMGGEGGRGEKIRIILFILIEFIYTTFVS